MAKADLIRKDFEAWMAGQNREDFSYQDEEMLVNGLSRIGIDIPSIYSVEDPLSVRLFASELLLKRTRCEITDFQQYRKMLQRLVSYAEYLDDYRKKEKNTTVSSHLYDGDSRLDAEIVEELASGNNNASNHMQAIVSSDGLKSQKTAELIANRQEADTNKDDMPTDDVLIVAYYLSRMDMKGVKELGYKGFSMAFKDLGQILGRKPATIKNMRDEFDPYFDNPRAGWYQRPLRKSRKIVFDRYSDVKDEELTSIVKDIISEYKSKLIDVKEDTEETLVGSIDSEKVHKTIKITSTTMKEIKRRKKR